MNTELIKSVESARKVLKEASVLLRKVAAGEGGVGHTASTEDAGPKLDADKVRAVYEDLAAAHLAKTAEIEPAVELAMKDPNELLNTIQKLALHCASAQVAKPVTDTAPRKPGQLVKKTASAFGERENGVQRMKRRCAELARTLPPE